MCVIISRQPGIELPFEKLENACITNSDGWGLSVADRGKLETVTKYDPAGNNAEEIAKILEQTKDQRVFLHLRYSTAGTKDQNNCHPFQSSTLKDDGRDISFMHNGTIYAFKGNTNFSDTYNFNQEIVSPLCKMMLAADPDNNPLENPLLPKLLKEYAGGNSIFLLYDQFGNEIIINKDKGHQYEGWWASNTYSFNRSYRSQSHTSYSGGSYVNGVWKTYDKEDKESGKESDSPKSSASASGEQDSSKVTSPTDNVVPFKLDDKTSQKITAVKEGPSSLLYTIKPPKDRDTFCDIVGIDRLESITAWEFDDIYDLVNDHPELSTVLITDLLYELYLKGKANVKPESAPLLLEQRTH